MKILALEFSSPCRSVAILDGLDVMVEKSEHVGETLSPLQLIEQVLEATKLRRDQVECVVVGLGPGSYTGIRNAIAIAQGWQIANGAKLLGINSIDATATQAQMQGVAGQVVTAFDAQRGEIYTSVYRIAAETLENIEPLTIISLPLFESSKQGGRLVIGPEVDRWFADGKTIFPTATALGRLAAARRDFVSGAALEPIYLRETSFVKSPPARQL